MKFGFELDPSLTYVIHIADHMYTQFRLARNSTRARPSGTLISGFRRYVDDICALLGYYAASCGNCLLTFRDNVSVPSSRVKSSSRKERKPAPYNVDSWKVRRGSNT
jgi:hypothetical protein